MDNVTNQTAINFALQSLSEKWQPRLLFWLGFRQFDADELTQLMPGSTADTVADYLATLQEMGIVNPITDDDDKWALTTAEDALRDLMISLCIWGRHQIDHQEERVPGEIVEPEKQASMKELVAYGQKLNKYFK